MMGERRTRKELCKIMYTTAASMYHRLIINNNSAQIFSFCSGGANSLAESLSFSAEYYQTDRYWHSLRPQGKFQGAERGMLHEHAERSDTGIFNTPFVRFPVTISRDLIMLAM